MVKNASEIIADAGQRPTAARLAVLNVLIAADGALTHAEIIERMSGGYHFDRVTIYRVLDWLTEFHLIHRIASDDRAWKFQVTLPNASHQHAHLHCTQCHKIICLDELQADLPAQITSKFQIESVDMIIKGRCPDCGHHD
jgi:Fur family ferric uptake transcriptional regulator